MTNSTTFPGEVNIPSNNTFKIGDSVPAFLAGVTSVSVSEGNAGTNCSVAVGGNATAKSLAFTIPKGNAGPNGNQGNSGNQGPQGAQGNQGNQGNRGNTGATGPAGQDVYNTNNALQSNYYIKSNGYAYISYAGTSQTFYATSNRIGAGGAGGGVFQGYHGDDHYVSQTNNFNPAVSMYSEYYLRCSGAYARSDERFKTDIKTLDTEKALKKINNIRPVSFYNKEVSNFQLGFIAQEVEKELPGSVISEKSFVSNINRVGSFSDKREAFTVGKDGKFNVKCSKYTFKCRDKTWPTDLKLNDYELLEFKTNGEKGEDKFLGEYRRDICGEPSNQRGFGQMDILIDDVGEDSEIQDGLEHDNEVYLLNGTRKEDARLLKYEEVFTVLTAAVQELDKQLQLDLEWIERLESKLN